MKHLYACIVFILIGNILFSVEKKTYASSIDQWIDITEKNITFNYCDPFEQEGIYSYEYKSEMNNGLDWLIIKKQKIEKKILMLQSDEWLILYIDNLKKTFFIGYYSFRGIEAIEYIAPQNIKASSELKEKLKTYYGYNISNLELDSP